MSKNEILPGTYTRPAHDVVLSNGTLHEAEHSYQVTIREDGKVGLTDVEAQGKIYGNANRVASVQWYKPSSPTLARKLANYTRVSA